MMFVNWVPFGAPAGRRGTFNVCAVPLKMSPNDMTPAHNQLAIGHWHTGINVGVRAIACHRNKLKLELQQGLVAMRFKLVNYSSHFPDGFTSQM